MEHVKPEIAANLKVKKEISSLRKITAELDIQVKKVEMNKLRLVKLEKAIAEGHGKIRALTSQLAKHFA